MPAPFTAACVTEFGKVLAGLPATSGSAGFDKVMTEIASIFWEILSM